MLKARHGLYICRASHRLLETFPFWNADRRTDGHKHTHRQTDSHTDKATDATNHSPYASVTTAVGNNEQTCEAAAYTAGRRVVLSIA